MDNNIKTENRLNTQLKTGNKTLENRLILAPMAGLNHIGFRELLKSFGGYGLLFTGMLNARAVPTENRYKSSAFRWDDDELDKLGVQIFGNEPDAMAEAAKRIEKEGFFCIDLNFGCSAKTICAKEYGAHLLKKPDLAIKIIESVRKAVSFPVFIKFRTGWEDDIKKASKLAKTFENAGADAITFHPRVAPDKRTRLPKWEYIGIIKESVNIPVFGNGNIFSKDDAKKVLTTTGCDGISIGRVAVAKPWIFSSWTQGKKFDYDIYESTLKNALYIFTRHFGEDFGIKLFKSFYLYFCSNFKYANQYSGLMLKSGASMDEIERRINNLFEKRPEISKIPNLNVFSR